MRGCRHSGVRVIIPPNTAPQPMRITCRYLRRERLIHPPPLMEGEACASKIMEVGPAGARFLGPVLIEVPHFASLRGKEREIIILRSDSGEVWREHIFDTDEHLIDSIIKSAELVEQQQHGASSDQENQRPSSAIGQSSQTDGLGGGDSNLQQQEKRLTRIVANEFPQYFAIISRIRQEVHTVGPEGLAVDSQVVPKVQAIFTDGALTKRIKIGLQVRDLVSV
jgi:ankyrin